MTESPGISSFVIRIIEETADHESAASFRGFIRHVQSDQELSFVHWSDVESFIQQFVPIQLMSPPIKDSGLSADSTAIN